MEHGITRAALENFFERLQQENVPVEKLDERLREIAGQLADLEDNLRHSQSSDEEVNRLKEQAATALEQGDIAEAELLLDQAVRTEARALENMETAAHEHSFSVAATHAELGALKRLEFRFDEAITDFRAALDALPNNSLAERARYLTQLGNTAMDAGRYADAREAHNEAVQIREAQDNTNETELATSLDNFANANRLSGRYDEAEPLYRRALEMQEHALGPDHPSVATTLNNLAGLLREQGKYDEAEPLYRRALDILAHALPNDHPNLAGGYRNLAGLLREMARNDEALEYERRAAEIEAQRAIAGKPA